MQIHPMFYIKPLSLTKNNPLLGQKLELRPLVIVADGKYEVYLNSILDSKINK